MVSSLVENTGKHEEVSVITLSGIQMDDGLGVETTIAFSGVISQQ
jgi:hypothetical protein